MFCLLLLQLLSVAVLTGTSSPSLSETCLFLLWRLLVTTVKGTIGGAQELKLVQVACHLMMVECMLFSWKQLLVLVLQLEQLDFAVF